MTDADDLERFGLGAVNNQIRVNREKPEHEAELKSAGIVRLSLFGSNARGTAVRHVSDVDLMAEFDSGREYSLLDRVRLENRLADMPGTKVDLARRGC